MYKFNNFLYWYFVLFIYIRNGGKNDKQTNKKGEKPKKPNDAKPPPKYEKVPEKIIPKGFLIRLQFYFY